MLAETGVSLGSDLDDMVIVPVASGQSLFDQASLFRILAEARGPEWLQAGERAIHRIIASRHEGEDDVTVITQDSILETLNRIVGTITLAVAAIATVSLLVAGILIANVMMIAVVQRRAEIGLLKALGARTNEIHRLFVLESLLLALTGATCGLALGLAIAWAANRALPAYDIASPPWAIAGAFCIALLTGLLAGVLPARRAARLHPIEALSRR